LSSKQYTIIAKGVSFNIKVAAGPGKKSWQGEKKIVVSDIETCSEFSLTLESDLDYLRNLHHCEMSKWGFVLSRRRISRKNWFFQ
jgi:hypothetical protein